ncbi:aldehyde dehydrogenase [Crepidotus variabilis]|uniref:Aldehyde dehydrogenase n=1 Tax=Crepidotus variabilis TaxID=179855 RepID=A0A9P6E497_9AGAR|nr:aldehyde dehydrogenase [Crepidotus variabilis]
MTGFTQLEEIPKIHAALRKTFRSGITKPIAWRRHQLHQLARLAQENADEIADCIYKDLGRPKQEAIMGDVAAVIERSLIVASNLEEWAKPEEPTVQPWQQSWNTRVEKQPKGVALIISPWNYPFILSVQPLYGAISAGCCAVIKPSEFSPHVSAFLAKAIPKYLEASAYKVILGAVPEITRVLELKWDHIFYTGNGRVARIISAAAAKHLTPTTLELGGKSPVLVDSSADIDISAKRILWGKVNNSGQICVAPDYILAEKAIVPQLIDSIKKHSQDFFPDGALVSKSYGKIVTDAHFNRLKGLLQRSKGKVVLGGQWDEKTRGIEPTVVIVEEEDALLEDELFGPILPILPVESIDEALQYLQDRDYPLILYGFSNNKVNKQKILDATMSGAVAFGDTFQTVAVNEVPFGGVGESGHGSQNLKYSYDSFSYLRPVFDIPFQDEQFFGARYPPYSEKSLEFFSALLKAPIPKI